MHDVGENTLNVMKKAKWYNMWTLSFVKKYLRGEILEVGAGIGNFSKLLSKYGSVTGIDIDRSYLGKKKEYGIKYGYGDIEHGKYFFKEMRFDSIVCFNVLEHIKNDSQALRNIYGLLKDNGYFVLLVPAHEFLFSEYDKMLGHFRRYGVSDLKEILQKNGFDIIKINYFNWWGALGWFYYMKIIKKEVFPDDAVGIFDRIGRLFLWPEKLVNPPIGLSVLAIVRKKPIAVKSKKI